MTNTTIPAENREHSSPHCPKCGSEKIHFSDTNELECQCGHLFEPPEHMRGKGTPKSKQEPQGVVSEEVLQRAKVGDPPRIPRFKDLESVKDYYWKGQKKELDRLEKEVKAIRKEREPILAKVKELESMFPFEELENYTVNARNRVPDPEGLPDKLIAAIPFERNYERLKSELAELDKQIEDKEVEINQIRSYGIIHGLSRVKVQLPDKLRDWEEKKVFPIGHTKTNAAKLCGVNRTTIYTWIKKGTIKETSKSRIPISEIQRLRRGDAPVIE